MPGYRNIEEGRRNFMKIFITGAGMLGCHTAKELTQAGHSVHIYDLSPDPAYVAAIAGKQRVTTLRGDLLDLPNLIRALARIRPDVLVHTAGLIGGHVENPPYRGFRTNTVGSVNVFEACQISRVKRLVHVSTFGVYDWANIRKGPIKENAPRWGNRFYPATKVANEVLLDAYENYYDMECVRIRPSGVYGPGHYRGGSGGGIAMNDLVHACLGEGPIRLEARHVGPNDFVYAADVGRGIALACSAKNAPGKSFNIAVGKNYGPQDFLQALQQLMPDRTVTLARGAGKVKGRPRVDVSAAQRILGYKPQYSLEKGLADYIGVVQRHGFWH